MLRVIDASSIIHGWDNYPPEQFPRLWKWVAEEIESKELQIPRVAFDEVKGKLAECADWLRDTGIEKLVENEDILKFAVTIHSLLGIEGDDYGNGVGENDILIIASAKISNAELITNEKIQNNLPINLKNCKIPAVCDFQKVCVPHIDFLRYLKLSGEVFG